MNETTLARVKLAGALGGALTLLAGCGNGGGAGAAGGTPSDGTTTATAQSAEGWWKGTVSASGTTRNVVLLISDSGRFYGIYDSNGTAGGLLTGVQTTTGSSLTTSGGLDYGIGAGASAAMSIAGSVTTQSTLSGTVTEGNSSVALSTSYNGAYGTAVTLNGLSASYGVSLGTLKNQALGYTLTRNAGSTSQYTLAPTDSSNTCQFTVTFTPHASVGYYDVSMATQSGCPSQYTAIGVGLPTSSTSLVLGAVLPDQSDMLLASATPQS